MNYFTPSHPTHRSLNIKHNPNTLLCKVSGFRLERKVPGKKKKVFAFYGSFFSPEGRTEWQVLRAIPLLAECSGAGRASGSLLSRSPCSERQGVMEELVDDRGWGHQVLQLQVEDALEALGANLPQFHQCSQDLGLGGLQSLSLPLVVL